MSIYSFTCLVAGITNLALAFFVWLRSPKRGLNIFFSLTGLSLSLWSFGLLGMSVAQDSISASFWMKVGSSLLFVPIFYFHFTMLITKNYRLINRIFLTTGYILTPILLFLDQQGLMVEAERIELYGLGYYPVSGPAHLLFGLVFVVFIGTGMWLLGKRYNLSTNIIEKSRLKHLLIGTAISILGSVSNFFLSYGITMYPIGHLTNLVYSLCVTYALVQYRLMEIELGSVIRKISISLIGLGVIAILFFFSNIAIEGIFPYIGIFKFSIFLIVILIAIAIFRSNIVDIIASLLIAVFFLTALTPILPKKIIMDYGLTVLVLLMFMIILSPARERVQIAIDKWVFRRKYEELKEVDKARSELLSELSHTLRSPLTSIRAWTEDLLKDEANPPRRRKLESILREIIFFDHIIQNILNLRRIQTGNIEMHKEEINLKELIEGIVSLFKLPAEDKGLKICAIVPDNLLTLKADRYMLTIILENLICNAVNYSKKGTITVGVEEDKKEVQIQVSDEGIGIPEKELLHIFDRFVRGKVAKGCADGTGFGLTITKSFVDFHEGNILVESRFGQGSKFTVVLPKEQYVL